MVLVLSPLKFLDRIPTRFSVGFMFFMSTFTAYMVRTNISIVLIPMVKESDSNSSLNGTVQHDYGPRYDWSKKDQSLILGGFFYGYLVTSLLGGVLSERYGGRQVVGLSMLLSAIATGISPLIACDNFIPTFINRVLLGIFGGVIYPGLHCLVSKWAPPEEKGKFISALFGSLLGTVFTWSSLGVVMQHFGWTFGFYIPAVIAIIVTVFWYVIVADSPEDHTRITKEERDFIQKSLGGVVSKQKQLPPVLSIMSSIPFLALLILHYGNLWGLYFLMNAAPMFMTQALNFNLGKAGFLSALPPLARLISGFIFGSIGDFMRRKNLFAVTTIRKSFCLFSHIIPGLFLLSITFLAFNKYLVVLVITLSLGFNGASTMTNLQNSQDLAPNYAGTLYGIINFIGTTSGFITPMIVAHYTEHGHALNDWQYVFWIGAAAYILPALLFFVFGSGKVQKWNEIREKKSGDDTKL